MQVNHLREDCLSNETLKMLRDLIATSSKEALDMVEQSEDHASARVRKHPINVLF